jgi:hypothetical protein
VQDALSPPSSTVWQASGTSRMVRDLFHIPGKVQIGTQGRILKITLNRDHVYVAQYLAAIGPALSDDDLVLNLRQI